MDAELGAEDVAESVAEVVLLPAPAPAIWKATLPPKGPASLLLTIFRRQKFDAPEVGSVPVQVVPSGILTENF